MSLSFPAKKVREGHSRLIDAYEVNADDFYPALLAELGFPVDEPTQYHLEVAYQAMKMDMQREFGFSIEIRIVDSSKKWAQSNYKRGKGAKAATEGREAREHYRKLRGYIPS